MKKRSSTTKTTVNLLASPLPLKTSHLCRDSHSKPSFDFSVKGFKTSASKKKIVTIVAASVLIQPRIARSPLEKAPTTISNLKDLVSSRSDLNKRHLDLSHSKILKEFEASYFRLSKRFKETRVTESQPSPNGDSRDGTTKKPICNCKYSRCLKL